MPDDVKKKLVPTKCMVCGETSESGTWVDIDYPMAEHAIVCKKPECQAVARWHAMTLQGRQGLAAKAGVGSRFIHDGLCPGGLTYAPAEIVWDISSCFVGPVRTGKTWALCALVCDALAAGHKALLINWHELQIKIRSTYQKGATETEHDLLKYYEKIDVLCIDDLGATKTSEAERTLLYAVLNARYAAEAITHISSNMTLDELKQRYDARIARRITEMCSVVVLTETI